MRVDDDRRGLRFTGGVTRVAVAGIAAAGLYIASNQFYSGGPRPDFQSTTQGEQDRDYFDYFTLDGIEIQLLAVTESPVKGQGDYVAILGRSTEDPSSHSKDWKFDIASGDKTFGATLSVLPKEPGSSEPFDLVIVASVPENLGNWRLDVSHDFPSEGAVRSIPLPIPKLLPEAQDKT